MTYILIALSHERLEKRIGEERYEETEFYVQGEERGDERGDVQRDGSEESVAPTDRWVRQGDGFCSANRPLGEARRRIP